MMNCVFSVFSGMAGLFTLSLKNLFPERIQSLSAGLKLLNPKSKPQILQLNLENILGKKISDRLIMWSELFRWDRRKSFSDFEVLDSKTSESMNIFPVTHSVNEVFLGGTTKWILKEPVKIGESKGYSYYVGTQLGNMGSSFVCEKCKSVIKYYLPEDRNEKKDLEIVFHKNICPLCGSQFSEEEKSKEILASIVFFATKFKKSPQESVNSLNFTGLEQKSIFVVY